MVSPSMWWSIASFEELDLEKQNWELFLFSLSVYIFNAVAKGVNQRGINGTEIITHEGCQHQRQQLILMCHHDSPGE